MRILAIETSCDETSIAVLESKKDGSFNLLSNIVSSQVKIHAPYGGVVPMLAKREHQRNLLPILKKSLRESRLLKIQKSKSKNQNGNAKFKILEETLNREETLLKKLLPFLKKYQKPDIDLIAVTNGPGLEPALWVGVNFAKALGYFWGLPVMPINHVEAHIIANWLPKSPLTPPKGGEKLPPFREGWGGFNSNRQSLIDSRFPALCLVVSGGHTQLVLMKKFGQYKILGETRDDAAGEAFDKLAKMLNLGYPGGPLVAKIASQRNFHFPISPPAGDLPKGDNFQKNPNSQIEVKLPRPMMASPNYDFSFSGLKTAALYFVKTLDRKTLKKLTPAICAEFQQAVVDVLVQKTIRAAKEFDVKTIMLGGGVAANDSLRESLEHETYNLKLNFSVPSKSFCGDNAAMIALTAAFKSHNLKIETLDWNKVAVDANLRLA